MKSLLSDLYHGKVFPDEQIYPDDPQYKELNKKFTEEAEYFQKMMTKEDFERLENLYEIELQSASLIMKQSFIHGFQLATMFMVEVFAGKEKLARD